MHLPHHPTNSQTLELFLALGFWILLTPFVIFALFCVFLALILLFPALGFLFFALFFFKILFKKTYQQQGFKEDSSSDETERLNKQLDLWRSWNPDSVEIPHPKPVS